MKACRIWAGAADGLVWMAAVSTVELSGQTIIMEFDRPIVLRDGTRLSADIYRPRSDQAVPVIVQRTPYDNNADSYFGEFFAEQGYAFVTVDARGRYDSDGNFYPYWDDGRDGYDVIQWASEQPWSDGEVGTLGGSYLGFNQWLAARELPPALKTMAVIVAPVDYYDSPAHTGGAFNLGGRLPWGVLVDGRTNQNLAIHDWDRALRHLPLVTADSAIGRDLPHFRDWVENAEKNEYWERFGLGLRWNDLDISVYHIGGWYDEFLRGTLAGFVHMREASGSHQNLLIGPWTHNVLGADGKAGDIDFGAESVVDFRTDLLQWFDRHLREVPTVGVDESPVRVFVMGSNSWQQFSAWPPVEARAQKFYLHSDGHANSLDGDGFLDTTEPGDEAADRFRYDPAIPVPTVGGGTCCVAPGLYPEIMKWGPQDQREVEKRSDVLVFTSVALEDPIMVVGPIRVRLFAASSAVDTDFTAKLVDVFPDGYAMNLTDGIIRARYRESFAQPSLMAPGEVYEFDVDLAATANTFQRGHRIRLEISSSNFPWYDRNLNTGGHPAYDTELRTADQLILHDRDHPSHILLPILKQ